MNGLDQFSEFIAIGVGMIGALIKGVKRRLGTRNLILTMVVAGILTYSVTGAVELFYDELTPKVIILISFIVGWLASEITEKLDLLIDDLYLYVKAFLNKKPKK
jgi:uncharacterized membrane protein YeaQ/YmgE (transglycosylase-associated protein family)